MPRISNRQRLLHHLSLQVEHRQRLSELRLIFSDSDSFEDELDLYQATVLEEMSSRRYATQSSYQNRQGRLNWDEYLDDNSSSMNATEFLRTFRLSRRSFRLLEEELRRTPVFSNLPVGRRAPRPLYQQLLVFLYRTGRYGNGGSDHEVGLYFGIASGSVRNYIQNIVRALKTIEDEVVSWPTQDERNAMKTRLASTGFRHCVGIADGTFVVLTRKPKIYHECYFCRKSCYAINVLVICDDRGKILYYLAGWPGSTHDNRVLKSSNLYLNRENYFSHLEYLLGDSAYSNSSIMVPAFKKGRNETVLPRDKELFNTHLARVRIKSEHCIGILKGRFQCLKGLNTYISRGEDDVKYIVDLVSACCILHNLLLSFDDEIPQEWFENLADEIDSETADLIENVHTVDGVEVNDGNRRNAVFHSVMEMFG